MLIDWVKGWCGDGFFYVWWRLLCWGIWWDVSCDDC